MKERPIIMGAESVRAILEQLDVAGLTERGGMWDDKAGLRTGAYEFAKFAETKY